MGAHKIGPGPWRELPARDPVVDQVRADLLRRSLVGIPKYGRTLEHLTKRQALQHAYEEALDLANYLRAALNQLDAEGVQ